MHTLSPTKKIILSGLATYTTRKIRQNKLLSKRNSHIGLESIFRPTRLSAGNFRPAFTVVKKSLLGLRTVPLHPNAIVDREGRFTCDGKWRCQDHERGQSSRFSQREAKYWRILILRPHGYLIKSNEFLVTLSFPTHCLNEILSLSVKLNLNQFYDSR